MADPAISQTPLHQPKCFDSSSSYDPEVFAGNSSHEVHSDADDEHSSLSGLKEPCSALQLITSSGSSTKSLDGLVDSHHHNQPFAESTDASTDPDNDSIDDDASPGAGV